MIASDYLKSRYNNFDKCICLCLLCCMYLCTARLVFCSPELKAQVSFSDRLPSVRPSLSFSQFYLLLQHNWTNFNQSWQKASLGEGDSSLFKLRATPFSKDTRTDGMSGQYLLVSGHSINNVGCKWKRTSVYSLDKILFPILYSTFIWF